MISSGQSTKYHGAMDIKARKEKGTETTDDSSFVATKKLFFNALFEIPVHVFVSDKKYLI